MFANVFASVYLTDDVVTESYIEQRKRDVLTPIKLTYVHVPVSNVICCIISHLYRGTMV